MATEVNTIRRDQTTSLREKGKVEDLTMSRPKETTKDSGGFGGVVDGGRSGKEHALDTGDLHKLRLMERQELTRDQFMQEMQEITDLTRSIVDKAKTFEDSDVDSKPFPGKSPIDSSDMIETYKAYQSLKWDVVIYRSFRVGRLRPRKRWN